MNSHQPITAARWADLTTEAKTAAISALVANGQSSGQMAMALHCSRSTILSHARRYKVELAVSKPRTRAPMLGIKMTPSRKQPILKSYSPVAADTWQPHRPGVTLVQLDDSQCRWPVGEAEGARQLFCGDHAVAGSYCCRRRNVA